MVLDITRFKDECLKCCIQTKMCSLYRIRAVTGQHGLPESCFANKMKHEFCGSQHQTGIGQSDTSTIHREVSNIFQTLGHTYSYSESMMFIHEILFKI